MRKRISSVLAGLLAALLLWGLAPVTAEAAWGGSKNTSVRSTAKFSSGTPKAER